MPYGYNLCSNSHIEKPEKGFKHWQKLPEGLLNFLTWRYSKFEWAKPWATWFMLALCRAGIRMRDFQRVYPIFITLWCYDLKGHSKVVLILFYLLMSEYAESHTLQGIEIILHAIFYFLSKSEALSQASVHGNLDSSTITLC